MSCKAHLTVKPEVTPSFDPATNTFSYVMKGPGSDACTVIDSVMDIDNAAGRIRYKGADAVIAFIHEQGLKVDWLIETHVHADHLSGVPYIQAPLGGRTDISIGSQITVVQETFERSSTKTPNSSTTAVSSIDCSWTATAFRSEAWSIPCEQHRVRS